MGLFDWLRRRKRPEHMPDRLILHASQFFLDGGTTILRGTDERCGQHTIMLVQNAFASGRTFGIPGQLYFDGKPVSVRSELESRVLALLRAAEIRYIPPLDDQQGERIQPSPNAAILGDDIRQVLTRTPEENLRALRDRV